MRFTTAIPLTLVPTAALALAVLPATLSTTSSATPTSTNTPLPLLIWHGLGDRYDADGIQSVASLAASIHPNTTVYPIRLSDDGSLDARASFFGNTSTYISSVCANLSSNPLFSHPHTRVDALGFSQGGQFLRGLVERCPGIRVRSLVTFGSQHNGIAEFQKCGTWDLLCKGAIAAARGNAYGEWAQDNIVPAQYYRETDPATGLGTDEYLAGSAFLADINNERVVKNESYKERIAALDKFVMYVFDEDQTVLPKESGWFAEVNTTSGVVTGLRDRRIYKEDWLGLRELDEKGGLVFRTTEGRHMALTEEVLTDVFTEFFGPERETSREAGRTRAQQVLGLS